jgi:hypothetical protein
VEERNKTEQAAGAQETSERDKRIAIEQEKKRRQKEVDDKLIAECNRNRNTYQAGGSIQKNR